MAGPPYWARAGALLLFGAAIRLIALSDPPYTHDEAIHASFARELASYTFEPAFHGPLLYHLVSVAFWLFGENDFAGRLVPAVLGIVLLALVLGPGQRIMGRRAAIWATALLAASPVMVAYQRRLLHEPLVLVLTVTSVFLLYRILLRPGAGLAWIGLAASVSLLLVTKLNALFVIGMLASFFLVQKLPRRCHQGGHADLPVDLPILAFFAVALASMMAVRDPPLTRERNEAVLLATCIVCSAVLLEWIRRGPSPSPHVVGEGWCRKVPRAAQIVLALSVAASLFAFFFGQGHLWWREPLAAIPGHLAGVRDALPRMLSYWIGQQRVPRLAGRHDYYLVLMTIYELPIVLVAVAGILHASRRRALFTDLVLWWAFTSLALYSIANEKVPWLLVHVMVPLALLGGSWLSGLKPRRPAAVWGFAAACLTGTVFLLRGVSATSFARAVDNREPMFYAATSELFLGAFREALASVGDRPGGIWCYDAWPLAWYTRDLLERHGTVVHYTAEPSAGPLKLAIGTESDWPRYTRFAGWKRWGKGGVAVPILVWPRASWQALRPDRFWWFWITRKASIENAVLSEWSEVHVVIATPPS